jgi:hypothetical protein
MVCSRYATGDQHTKSFARRRDVDSFSRCVEFDEEDGVRRSQPQGASDYAQMYKTLMFGPKRPVTRRTGVIGVVASMANRCFS